MREREAIGTNPVKNSYFGLFPMSEDKMKFIVSKEELYKFSHKFAMLCHDVFFQEALTKEKKQIPAKEFIDDFIGRLQIYKEKED